MIKEISSLRFIFIFFIFLHHIALFNGGGSMAVAFFFVLGGFGMTMGYRKKILASDFSYKSFVKKRFIKFYPLHWICLLAAVPFVILNFKWWQIPNFLLNALLVQSWIPLQQVYFSYNAVAWYLADTVFFALVFPPLLKFIIKTSVRNNLLFAVAIAISYTLLIILLPEKFYHAIFYINPLVRTVDFVIGIYLALLFLKLQENKGTELFVKSKHILLHIVCILLVAGLIFISNILTENQRTMAVFYWLPITLLIITTSLLGVNNSGGYLSMRWLVKLGECSFVFFMIHQLVIRYFDVFFKKIIHFDNHIVFVVICLMTTILLSLLTVKYILNPVTKWITQKI